MSSSSSSNSGGGLSSFWKDTRTKFDSASEKGRNYINKDHHNPLNRGDKNEETNAPEARPLSALKDPKLFPAPPVHRVAHGQAPALPPGQHHAAAHPAGAPSPGQYPQYAAQQPYQPPGYLQPGAQAGYATPGYAPPGTQPPQAGYPAPAAAPVPQAGYQAPAPQTGYQPPAYQPPTAAPPTGYQPPATAPPTGYQPPATAPAAYQPPATAPPAVYQPPVAAPPTGYQPPGASPAPAYQPPSYQTRPGPAAAPQLPSRQNSVAYARQPAPSPALPTRAGSVSQPPINPSSTPPAEQKPRVPLPDPSSFPKPPPLYRGSDVGVAAPAAATPGASSLHHPAPTYAESQPLPPPPLPGSARVGYSPSVKKKPPPVPGKLNKKPPPVPPGRDQHHAAPAGFSQPPSFPPRAPTFEEHPPPPYSTESPGVAAAAAAPLPLPARQPSVSETPPVAAPAAAAPAAAAAVATPSPPPAGPVAGGTASQIAQQFEKMHIMVPQQQKSQADIIAEFSARRSSSFASAPAPAEHAASSHNNFSAAAHLKKAPPKPPRKPSLASLSSHAAAHSPVASSPAAPSPAAPSPAAPFPPTPEQHHPSGAPPPINYSTRPSISEPGAEAGLVPSTSHNSTSSATAPAAPVTLPAAGPSKNDPNGQFDLDLASLWFTKPARSLTLPASLQGLNYTFSLSSSGSNRKLVLALRIAETLAIVKFKLEWQVADPIGTVAVERRDLPAPQPLAQPQLTQAHDAFGEGVARYAESVVGTQVGDGECWTLAQQAITQSSSGAAMAPQGYTHGALVYHAVGGGPAPLAYADRIQRGDICQFTSGRFDKRNPAGVIVGQSFVGQPNHTSVVVHVSDNNRVVDVLHQNVGGVRRVQQEQHNLDELTAGDIKIFRPVWKEWAGELEAKWD